MVKVLSFLLIIISVPALSQTTAEQDSILLEKVIFTKVELEASFPGGEKEWKLFLEKNLDPMTPIQNGAPVGIYKVIVQFIVDRSGVVSDIRALTNFGYGMESEVIRIFKKSPNWQPAMQNQRTVKAYRIQPVIFIVDAEDFNVEMTEKYVLYTGMENLVKINVTKVKSEDLLIIPSQGTALPVGNGNFKIKVNNPGKLIIDIYNNKKNKPIGSVYFVVQVKS